MRAFETNFVNVIVRFYLMMAVVLIAGFTGFWAVALLGLPIFLTGILGLGKVEKAAKIVKIETAKTVKHTKAA